MEKLSILGTDETQIVEAMSKKRYEQLADQIAKWIDNSTYSNGAKLPSIRTIAEMYEVSVTTVVTALRLLESHGVVDAKERVGYFVSETRNSACDQRHFSELNPRHLAGNNFIRDLVNLSHQMSIPLGSAIPVSDYLPKRQIQRALLKAARRASDTLCYSFPGNEHYLSSIARRMTRIGVNATISDIIATNGAQEAVVVALRSVANEGDTVAISAPTYPGILHALKVLRLKVIEIPCHSDGQVSFEALKFAVSNFDIRALCVSLNVGNPTGYTHGEAEKIELLEIMSEYRIPIIEDDVYGDLHYDSCRPFPLKAYDKRGMVIYCSSFSKTISPGLRAGWIIPGEFYAQVSDQKYFLNLSNSAVTQMAVGEYLESGSYDLYLRKIRRQYEKNTKALREMTLREFPKGTHCTRPAGGYLLWVTLPFDIDTSEIYESALKEGIYFAPGRMFSTSKQTDRCLRISGSHPINSDIENSICYLGSRIASAVK